MASGVRAELVQAAAVSRQRHSHWLLSRRKCTSHRQAKDPPAIGIPLKLNFITKAVPVGKSAKNALLS